MSIDHGILQLSPIEISLANRKVTSEHFAYLYISSAKKSDAKWGQFQIEIKNTGSTPIAFTSASTIQVHVPTDLLATADLDEIQLEEGSENIWACTVTANTLLLRLKQDRLEIASLGTKIFLGNMLATAKTALRRSVTFEWVKVTGIDDNSRSFFVYRELIEEKNTPAEIRCSLGPRPEYLNKDDCVYFTPRQTSAQYEGVKNRLVLRISNQGPVLEGEGAELLVSFPTQEYGDAKTALCTTTQLAKVNCFPLDQSGWRSTPEMEGETKYWILRPPLGAKIALNEKQTVQFEFTGIVTELTDGTAYAQVNWRGISGKNPGYNTLAISKLPPFPYVKTMSAIYEGKPLPMAGCVYFNEPFSVKWESFAADNCVIEETGERLAPDYTKNLIADKEIQKITITPEISVPATNFIRKGNSVSLEIPLCESVMNVKQELQSGIVPSVKLTWESKGGKVWMTAPIDRRVELPAKGTSTESISGLYQFDCVGLKTRTASPIVNVPHANMSCNMEWSPDGSTLTLSWTSQNANKFEIWAVYNGSPTVKTTPPVQGTQTLNTAGLIECILRATGNGDFILYTQKPRRGSNFPRLTVNETKLDTGLEHRLAWKIENLKEPFGYVWVNGSYFNGLMTWPLTSEGTIDKHFRNGTRDYCITPQGPEGDMFVAGIFPTGMPAHSIAEQADELRALLLQHIKTDGNNTA